MKKLPKEEGVYEVLSGHNMVPKEIDVYEHPIKGLCCFSEDFYSGGTNGVNDSTDCHVSIIQTDLNFGKRLRDLWKSNLKSLGSNV